MFIKRVRISGNFHTNYVFKSETELNNWLDKDLKELQKKYGELNVQITDLDGLNIGDNCYVIGDGDVVYRIIGLKNYSPNRYGFVLNSGWVEEVAKCYKMTGGPA